MDNNQRNMSSQQPADILIVDDDPESLWLLLQLLSQAGFKVRPARDGQQALSAARLAPPNLILLDVIMPNMTGYEVCEALKADETTRDSPVIFISGLNQVFDKMRAFSAGGVDYVSKPYQNEEILARVKTHLTLHKLQKELQQRNTELQQEIANRKQAELLLQETNNSLQQRILELTILHFIGQTLVTVSDIKAALDTVVHIVNRLFNIHATSVSIVDPVAKELTIITSHNLHKSDFSTNAPANDEPVIVTPISLFRGRLLKETAPLASSPTQTSPALSPVQWLFRACCKTQEFLIAPLQVRDEVIGLLTLAVDRPEHDFSLAEEYLAETIADQIAGAVKVAQLFEAERRQGQLAESLRQVATVLSSSLDRSTILNIIFEQLRQVLQYDGAALGLIAGDELVFVQVVGHTIWQVNDRLPLKSENVLIQVLQERQVVILTNVAEAATWPNWFRSRESGSWMGAPLAVGRSVSGVLTIEQDQVGAYRQEDAKILQTFANQAALAIENARLYEQAQTVAIDAERQRLARELHDSVTQSLYSLTLLTNGWAATARRGESDVPQMVKQFKQLEEISLQGLKEMRLLLHHLRPPILEEVGLVGALQQRLDSVEQRVNVKTRLLTQGPVDELPLALTEQLFAIAHEALTNILRHAEATEVVVMLRREEERLTLAVTDNGAGFDPVAPSFGFGLNSIRERTEAIGGQLEITSAPEQGTTVMVTVALRPEEGV